MPVYEFYCAPCHTIFNFFSRRVDTETLPDCPRCGRQGLDRQLSQFAISKGRGETQESTPEQPADLNEERMMQAFAAMSGELEGLNEDNPKEAARLMKRLFDASGMRMGEGMAEALKRLEAGEDPDRIEADMGDVFEQEDPFTPSVNPGGHPRGIPPSLAALHRKLLPPARDETWYPLRPD